MSEQYPQEPDPREQTKEPAAPAWTPGVRSSGQPPQPPPPQPPRRSAKSRLATVAAVLVGIAAAVGLVVAGVFLIPDLLDDDEETGRFPLEVERNFLDGCEQAGGSVARCQCALDAIEENYTLEEYATLDARIARTGEVPEEYRDLLEDCPDPPTATSTPS